MKTPLYEDFASAVAKVKAPKGVEVRSAEPVAHEPVLDKTRLFDALKGDTLYDAVMDARKKMKGLKFIINQQISDKVPDYLYTIDQIGLTKGVKSNRRTEDVGDAYVFSILTSATDLTTGQGTGLRVFHASLWNLVDFGATGKAPFLIRKGDMDSYDHWAYTKRVK